MRRGEITLGKFLYKGKYLYIYKKKRKFLRLIFDCFYEFLTIFPVNIKGPTLPRLPTENGCQKVKRNFQFSHLMRDRMATQDEAKSYAWFGILVGLSVCSFLTLSAKAFRDGQKSPKKRF